MINSKWKKAISIQKLRGKSPQIPNQVLFLDEMCLAEQSNKKPLKVLHKLLQNPEISLIGLSNWSLDSAKMNRVVIHEVMPIHQDSND